MTSLKAPPTYIRYGASCEWRYGTLCTRQLPTRHPAGPLISSAALMIVGGEDYR